MPVTFDDPAAVERALADAFPTLAVAPLLFVHMGFGSLVVQTRDGVIFRIARHARTAAGHAREAAVLHALAPRVPTSVPEPLWRVEPGSPHFPHGAIGYRRLPGKVMAPRRLPRREMQALAVDIASFLAALHKVPVAEAEGLGLTHADRVRGQFEKTRAVVLPYLRDVLTYEEHDRVAAWSDEFIADDEVDRFDPALRHGDLWFGNVLVDERTGRLIGVLDWEGAAIGDPASDLSRQLHLGENFLGAVLSAYEAHRPGDQTLRHRIRRRWELLEFAGVRTALELDDSAELAETVEKLRAGPILSRTL